MTNILVTDASVIDILYETVSANSGNWQDTYTIITVPDLTAVPDVAP